MVPEEHLARIGGLNQTLYGVIRIAAPPLGALLLELLPMQGVLAVDVGTAVVAIAPLFFIQVPQPADWGEAESTNGRASFVASVLADVGDGLRFIWGWVGLRVLLGIVMLLNILCWPAGSLTPILVTDHFGGGAFELGWLESAGGVGAILGGLVLSVGGLQAAHRLHAGRADSAWYRCHGGRIDPCKRVFACCGRLVSCRSCVVIFQQPITGCPTRGCPSRYAGACFRHAAERRDGDGAIGVGRRWPSLGRPGPADLVLDSRYRLDGSGSGGLPCSSPGADRGWDRRELSI
jgi:hypothetical protein